MEFSNRQGDRRFVVMSATTSIDVAYPVTEPLPVLATKPRLRDTFSSMRTPNFRRYIAGLGASSAGAWLARLATDWLMVEVTGSVGFIALVVSAQLVPPMLLGPWGGVIGDRFSARRTVMAAQVLYLVAVLALAIPAILGVATVPLIVLTSLLIGVAAAFEGPSRAVFLVEVVGTRTLPNAMSLNASVQQVAGIAGAALSGVLIALTGVGWAMAVAAVGPAIGLIALAMIRRDRLYPAIKIPAQRGQIREALRYVRRKPQIGLSLLLIMTLAMFGLTGSVMFAWAAREEFGLGAIGYSLFQTASAVGAAIGGLMSARRRELRLEHNAIMLAVSSGIWMVTGFSPVPAIFVAALVATMATRLLFMIGNDSLTQLSANGAIRGRVVSLYIVCMTGAQAIGAILTGWAIDALGGPVTFLISGGVPLLVSLTVIAVLMVRARRDATLLALD